MVANIGSRTIFHHKGPPLLFRRLALSAVAGGVAAGTGVITAAAAGGGTRGVGATAGGWIVGIGTCAVLFWVAGFLTRHYSTIAFDAAGRLLHLKVTGRALWLSRSTAIPCDAVTGVTYHARPGTGDSMTFRYGAEGGRERKVTAWLDASRQDDTLGLPGLLRAVGEALNWEAFAVRSAYADGRGIRTDLVKRLGDDPDAQRLGVEAQDGQGATAVGAAEEPPDPGRPELDWKRGVGLLDEWNPGRRVTFSRPRKNLAGALAPSVITSLGIAGGILWLGYHQQLGTWRERIAVGVATGLLFGCGGAIKALRSRHARATEFDWNTGQVRLIEGRKTRAVPFSDIREVYLLRTVEEVENTIDIDAGDVSDGGAI